MAPEAALGQNHIRFDKLHSSRLPVLAVETAKSLRREEGLTVDYHPRNTASEVSDSAVFHPGHDIVNSSMRYVLPARAPNHSHPPHCHQASAIGAVLMLIVRLPLQAT